jgi:FkbM family methyltransferase
VNPTIEAIRQLSKDSIFVTELMLRQIVASERTRLVPLFGALAARRVEFYPSELLADPGFYESAKRIGYGYCEHLARMTREYNSGDRSLERFGSSYGGWWLVPSLKSDDVVISGGIGDDTSFDVAVIERFGCRVIGVDPTPAADRRSAETERDYPRFQRIRVGLWDEDVTLRFYNPPPGQGSMSISNIHGSEGFLEFPVKRVVTLCQELTIDRIAVLKLDIEGAAYRVIEDALNSGVEVDQILLECDMPTPPWTIENSFRVLHAFGFSCVKVEKLNFSFVREG